MNAKRRRWTQDEQLIVFRFYSKTPFGRLNKENPEVVELAELIERTPSSIVMKACNFASLDPYHHSRGVIGLSNVSNADKSLWSAFEPIYLPPYSPDFNPIERLWLLIKAERFTNFIAKIRDELWDLLDKALVWAIDRTSQIQ